VVSIKGEGDQYFSISTTYIRQHWQEISAVEDLTGTLDKAET
jgi:hypothetical protein